MFFHLPIENQIKHHQQEYYDAISKSHQEGSSTTFIEFMLDMIFATLKKLIEDIKRHPMEVTEHLKQLLAVLTTDYRVTASEILTLMGLKSRENLRKNYPHPALKAGLIKLELPGHPTSRNQRYIKN